MRTHLQALLAAGLFWIVVGQATADDPGDVKQKLAQAKTTYNAEIMRFKKGVLEALEKHADGATKAGDQQRVAQVKLEREAFEKCGDVPALTPIAVRAIHDNARAQLDAAFNTAITDLVRFNADHDATAIKREYQQFLAEVPFGNPIKVRLYHAKMAYENELKKFRDDVGAHFDRREAVARKDGNKKLLDEIRDERKVFAAWGGPPKNIPATLRQKPEATRATLEKAYAVAVKEFTKAKQDDEAATADKEFQAFSKLIGSWKDGDRGNIFVFKSGGAFEEFLPTSERNTTGEWRLEPNSKVTIVAQNGFKLVGSVAGVDTLKADVFGPGGDTPIITIALRRIVK